MYRTELFQNEQGIVVAIEGSVKTADADTLGPELLEVIQNTDTLIIDMGKTEFICSAMLRALLSLQAFVDEAEEKEMILKNVNDEICDVLNMTGFMNILTVV